MYHQHRTKKKQAKVYIPVKQGLPAFITTIYLRDIPFPSKTKSLALILITILKRGKAIWVSTQRQCKNE